MDCSLPSSSIHGIFQATVLEWIAISFSRDLTDLGIKPTLQADTLPSKPPGKPEQRQCFSNQFSHSVMSDSLQLHELQHARPPCLLPTQTHVHRVSDAIQPSHPLSPPSPAFNLPQHQGLFQWVNSSHKVAKVLEFQHQSFQWTPRTDLL